MNELMDPPDCFDGPEDEEVLSIPITRAIEARLASTALGKVQSLMDEAAAIHWDLAKSLASDHGIDLEDSDEARFAEDESGQFHLLLLLNPRA